MPVVVASALLGFCGVVYEFVLAQSLSILFGNSVVQYSLTIGIFIAGMGLGSHLAERFLNPRLAIWRSQAALSLFAPSASLGFWWLAVAGHSEVARAMAYTSILAIGFLTGFELPLLLKLRNTFASGTVLAADYLGMLSACLLFPLFLLPELGVFKTLFLTALINSLVMISLWPRQVQWQVLCPLGLLGMVYLEPWIRTVLSQKLVGG